MNIKDKLLKRLGRFSKPDLTIIRKCQEPAHAESQPHRNLVKRFGMTRGHAVHIITEGNTSAQEFFIRDFDKSHDEILEGLGEEYPGKKISYNKKNDIYKIDLG